MFRFIPEHWENAIPQKVPDHDLRKEVSIILNMFEYVCKRMARNNKKKIGRILVGRSSVIWGLSPLFHGSGHRNPRESSLSQLVNKVFHALSSLKMGHGSPLHLRLHAGRVGVQSWANGDPGSAKKKLVNLERLISQMGVCTTTPKDSITAPSILVARQVLLFRAASFQAIHFRWI